MTATQDLVANGTTGGSHRIMWLPVAVFEIVVAVWFIVKGVAPRLERQTA